MVNLIVLYTFIAVGVIVLILFRFTRKMDGFLFKKIDIPYRTLVEGFPELKSYLFWYIPFLVWLLCNHELFGMGGDPSSRFYFIEPTVGIIFTSPLVLLIPAMLRRWERNLIQRQRLVADLKLTPGIRLSLYEADIYTTDGILALVDSEVGTMSTNEYLALLKKELLKIGLQEEHVETLLIEMYWVVTLKGGWDMEGDG